MKISGLVQARMGSIRLPGKVMKKIVGKPLIGHIFDRLKKVSSLENIILATTSDPQNDELISYAKKQDILIYRHAEEDDIIARLYEAAELYKSDMILKVNADCPLVDPILLDIAIKLFKESKEPIDIASNKIKKTFPEGYSYELVSTEALKWCNENLDKPIERELAILWIINNSEQFPNRLIIENEIDYSEFGLTVDTKEDFDLVSKIYKKLYKNNKYFGMDEVIAFVKSITK